MRVTMDMSSAENLIAKDLSKRLRKMTCMMPVILDSPRHASFKNIFRHAMTHEAGLHTHILAATSIPY